MKSLAPPLIEPASGPPKPPCPIEAAAAAADPPDDREEDELETELLDVRALLEEDVLPPPNRFEEALKPKLDPEDPEAPEDAELPDAELSEELMLRPAVADDALLPEELEDDGDPPPPCPPDDPPRFPPPPPPPDELTVTVIRPPPPDTVTVVAPPRPPLSCGTSSDAYFSGTVTPVSRIVRSSLPLVAVTVFSPAGAPPPGP
ncbi:MAG: hypothetical protein HXY18_13175, partial [Bryobacteraceae bacterium]|nr:hypothetical protein [Bryobacteraceae bacterium]